MLGPGVTLAEIGIRVWWCQPERGCDDLAGLPRARQVARPDRGELRRRQPRRQLARLLASDVVELDIGVALQPAERIPAGLPVAREQDPTHTARSA